MKWFIFFAVAAQASLAWADKKCFHVDSYHVGYEWADGISKGIDETLKGKCAVEHFRMDTKRNPDPAFSKKKGEEAHEWIEAGKPDIVIISDDNAAVDVMNAYYKDAKLPFVFCGINWTIEQYGLPFRNTTGMIEVAPIQQMMDEVKKSVKSLRSVAFVSMDNETEQKDFGHITKILKARGITLKPYFATTFADWKKQWVAAQKEDFVYFSNSAGIKNWDKQAATEWVSKNTQKLSGSTYDWQLAYVPFVMSKSPYEQGEWAARAALQILDGKAPNLIEIVANKKFEPMLNPQLYKLSPVKLSAEFVGKADTRMAASVSP